MDMGVHIFLKGISPKGNVRARLECAHAYYDLTVQLHGLRYCYLIIQFKINHLFADC